MPTRAYWSAISGCKSVGKGGDDRGKKTAKRRKSNRRKAA